MSRDTLPPTLRLLVDEEPRNLADLQGLLPELRRQAEWTLQYWRYATVASRAPGAAVLTPAGPLDPLAVDVCIHPACRKTGCQSFITTLGVYGDVIVLPDWLSAEVHFGSDERAVRYLETVLPAILAIRPLLDAGAIEFGRARPNGDPDGARAFIRRLATRLITDSADGIRLTWHAEPASEPYFEVTGGPFGDIYVSGSLTQSQVATMQSLGPAKAPLPPKGVSVLREHLELDLCRTAWRMLVSGSVASRVQGTVVAQWGADASMLDLLAGQMSPSRDPSSMIGPRMEHAVLPWIADLSAAEVVALRQDAGPALDRLRIRLGTLLRSPGGATAEQWRDAVRTLMEEAIEIGSRLDAFSKSGGRRLEILRGALGLSLLAYGIAQDALLSACVGVFGAAGQAINTLRSAAAQEAALKSRPGFAILRARHLAEHGRRGPGE